MAEDTFETLSSDLPTTDPAGDELGYAPFARKLANAILRMPAPEGFVIGINGAWGLGKSTAVSFVLHYLREEPPESQPLIFEFSPWMFSGHEDLTRRFCEQLLAVLTSNEHWKQVANNIKRPLAGVANALSEVPGIGQYAKATAKVLDSKPDIHALKKTIGDALARDKRKIVVVIDDIDRLAGEEMHQVFRVVKAVANFPNVIYLVVFDKEIVAKALTTPAMNGAAYLEKIIQDPFDIPLPARARLDALFIRRLNAVLGDVPDALFDAEHWTGLYAEGIRHFLRTPRHVFRLINSLTVLFAMVRDEVNPTDLVAIEALRLFCPAAYDAIRGHKEEFTGHVEPSWRRDHDAERRKAFHDGWLQTVPEADRDAVQKTVQRLFPRLRSVWGNTYYGADSFVGWKRQLRVCVADRFDVYFGFALPQDMLSSGQRSDFRALTKNAGVLAEVFERLLAQNAPERARRLRIQMGELSDYAGEEMPAEDFPAVLETLFRIGDNLVLADERQGMFDFGVEWLVGHIPHVMVRRTPKPQRFALFRDAIAQGTAVSTIVDAVTMLGSDQTRHPYGRDTPGEEQRLTIEEAEALERLGVERIEEAAQNGSLPYCPGLLAILYRWRDWAGDSPRWWVDSQTASDAGLRGFLGNMLCTSYSHAFGEYLDRTHQELDTKQLEPFLDMQAMTERLLGMVPDDTWSDQEKAAVALFLKAQTQNEQQETTAASEDEDGP